MDGEAGGRHYLELGLGIAASFAGFFEGRWSAGDDMLRCVADVPSTGVLRVEVTLDKGSSTARVFSNRRGVYCEYTIAERVLAGSVREGILGLSMASHAVNWRRACHCMVLCREETRGDAEVQLTGRE